MNHIGRMRRHRGTEHLVPGGEEENIDSLVAASEGVRGQTKVSTDLRGCGHQGEWGELNTVGKRGQRGVQPVAKRTWRDGTRVGVTRNPGEAGGTTPSLKTISDV